MSMRKSENRVLWDGPPVMYAGRWVMPGEPVPKKPKGERMSFEEWVKEVYGLDPKENVKEVEA